MTIEHSRPGAGNWLSRLARQLGVTPIPADVAEHLAGLQSAVAALARAQAQNQAVLDALRENAEKLEKQVSRAGKEQFKANALAETGQKSVSAMMEQLREADAYRERELAHLRERLAGARDEGRLDIIKGLLPVLDGLDEALASGERLLRRAGQTPAPTPPAARASFWRRLHPPPPSPPGEALSPQAVAAWLEGLTFVRDRMLDVLAAEGVYPIETEGEIFDPHRHVAVETVPAAGGVEPDAIVRETRRGYLRGDTVLRYAEVVVAR